MVINETEDEDETVETGCLFLCLLLTGIFTEALRHFLAIKPHLFRNRVGLMFFFSASLLVGLFLSNVSVPSPSSLLQTRSINQHVCLPSNFGVGSCNFVLIVPHELPFCFCRQNATKVGVIHDIR